MLLTAPRVPQQLQGHGEHHREQHPADEPRTVADDQAGTERRTEELAGNHDSRRPNPSQYRRPSLTFNPATRTTQAPYEKRHAWRFSVRTPVRGGLPTIPPKQNRWRSGKVAGASCARPSPRGILPRLFLFIRASHSTPAATQALSSLFLCCRFTIGLPMMICQPLEAAVTRRSPKPPANHTPRPHRSSAGSDRHPPPCSFPPP